MTGEYLRLRSGATGAAGSSVDPAELAAIVARRRRRRALARATPRRSSSAHARPGEAVAAIVAARGFRQISDARRPGGRRRRRPRGQPGGRRRLPGRQAPGGRLPRRPGHEGDPRPGQRRAGPGRRARAPRRAGEQGRAERWGRSTSSCGPAGVVLSRVGYTRARGPWARYQALKAQDANVARYESWRGGVRDDEHDRRLGGDGDPPPPGPDRRRRSRSSGSS